MLCRNLPPGPEAPRLPGLRARGKGGHQRCCTLLPVRSRVHICSPLGSGTRGRIAFVELGPYAKGARHRLESGTRFGWGQVGSGGHSPLQTLCRLNPASFLALIGSPSQQSRQSEASVDKGWGLVWGVRLSRQYPSRVQGARTIHPPWPCTDLAVVGIWTRDPAGALSRGFPGTTASVGGTEDTHTPVRQQD